jgi:hypothetical protein
MMSASRYLPAANYIAHQIPDILAKFGLRPDISRFVLTETEQGAAWLFIVLEVSLHDQLDDYANSDVMNALSVSLNGIPVVVSRSNGLRYAILLSSSSTQNRIGLS